MVNAGIHWCGNLALCLLTGGAGGVRLDVSKKGDKQMGVPCVGECGREVEVEDWIKKPQTSGVYAPPCCGEEACAKRARRKNGEKVCKYPGCGRVVPKTLSGRPKEYCNVLCRRRAQRERDDSAYLKAVLEEAGG